MVGRVEVEVEEVVAESAAAALVVGAEVLAGERERLR